MIDPITAAVGKQVVESGQKAATSLLNSLLGPAIKEYGESLADRVRAYRVRNQVKLLNRTYEMLAAAGIKPEPIPPRVLFPLLEYATLEDDDELSEMWAALLANTALGGAVKASIYVDVLRQISPPEARLLFALRQPESHTTVQLLWLNGRTRAEGEVHPLRADEEELLAGLQLLEPEDIVVALAHLVGVGVVQRTVGQGSVGSLLGTSHGLTLFGDRLLDACAPPRSMGSPPDQD